MSSAIQRTTGVACVFASSALNFADTIALKSAVTLPASADVVKLSDIANLDGDAALSLASVSMTQLGDSQTALELSVQDIRAKLDAAGAHWGRINLSGRKVAIVRPQAMNASTDAPLAMTGLALGAHNVEPRIASKSADEHLAADVIHEPTLRGSIASLLISEFATKPGHLRLRFNAGDRDFLGSSTRGTRFELQTMGNSTSDRVNVTVRQWVGGKAQPGRIVEIHPIARIETATPRHEISRDQMIADSDLDSLEQWLPPSQVDMMSTKIAAVGRVAGRTLKAGEPIRFKDIRRQTLVQRGDLVVVRCLVGGIAVSLQAEARANAFEGDTIEFRKSGEREPFLATVTARGEAVIDLGRKSFSSLHQP